LRFVAENPGRERRDAVKSVRQESERAFARLGDNARHAGFLGEDLEWQENLKIHFFFTSPIGPIM
jgi:hypothetical protein